MSNRILLVAVLLSVIAGCSLTSREPLTVADLRMPQDGYAGIERIEDKSVYVDNYGDAENLPVPAQALRNQGIASSAYYKYWISGDTKGAYKVKMNVYTGSEALETDWERRYPKVALQGTTPLQLGDGGFRYGDRIAAFHTGNVLVEIEASGGVSGLDPFLATYAEFVLDRVE